VPRLLLGSSLAHVCTSKVRPHGGPVGDNYMASVCSSACPVEADLIPLSLADNSCGIIIFLMKHWLPRLLKMFRSRSIACLLHRESLTIGTRLLYPFAQWQLVDAWVARWIDLRPFSHKKFILYLVLRYCPLYATTSSRVELLVVVAEYYY